MHMLQQVGGGGLAPHTQAPLLKWFWFCFLFFLPPGIEAEVNDWLPSSGWASCHLASCTPFTGAENAPGNSEGRPFCSPHL